MLLLESLNCFRCNEPFERVVNRDRTPVHLKCGRTICYKCSEYELFDRTHPCYLRGSDCYSRNIAYYLIDILSQEAGLILAPNGRGYLLTKSFQIPECPICYERYSNEIPGKKSSSFQCGHAVCTECYLQIQQGDNILCPLCKSNELAPNPEANGLNVFLNELPEMIRQVEWMSGRTTLGRTTFGGFTSERPTFGGNTYGRILFGAPAFGHFASREATHERNLSGAANVGGNSSRAANVGGISSRAATVGGTLSRAANVGGTSSRPANVGGTSSRAATFAGTSSRAATFEGTSFVELPAQRNPFRRPIFGVNNLQSRPDESLFVSLPPFPLILPSPFPPLLVPSFPPISAIVLARFQL